MTTQTQTTPQNGATAQTTTGTAIAEVKPTFAPTTETSAYELVLRKAKALSSSMLVPPEYRGSQGIANCILAQNMADRIGADALMVIQNLDIVHGRPGFRSTFIIATVNASRRFSPLRFEWFNAPKPGERPSAHWGCRAYATSREDGKECVGMTITWDLATREGWTTKKGSKWQTMPEQMFMYRAASFWSRVYCPELMLGMRTADELDDGYDLPGELPAQVTVKAEDASGERRAPLTSADMYDDDEPAASGNSNDGSSDEDPDAGKGVGD